MSCLALESDGSSGRTPVSDPDVLDLGVLQALPEAALLVDTDGAIVAANGAAAAMLGAPRAALQGARLADLMADDDRAIGRYLHACARTRSPLPGALHRRATVPGAGEPHGAPLAAEARQSVAGAVVAPASAGSRALILLRFRASEGLSNRFTQLNLQLAELTREVRARRAAEAALIRANESLNEQARAVIAANDALSAANAELRETTDAAERARRDAELANRSKSDFLAMMSHELRTPLNAIGGYVELLELGIRGPVTDAQRDDLRRIQRAQRHLLVLISEVLDFARLEAGQALYNTTAVVVDVLLRGLEPLITPQLQAQRLRYAYEGMPESVVAWADREKLEQILLNLLSNAIKFTPQGGVIGVCGEADGSVVRISVLDTGIGIAREKLERIFEPFVQLDQTLTRSQEGVGLGLAISRDLARGMHGELSARSTVDEGSTFTLTLPTPP